MSGILEEVKYFVNLAEKVPPIRWSRFRPFKVTFKMGSPVCVTTPWVSFDGLIAHLMMMDAFGQDFFITPKKLDLSPYLPHNQRLLPILKTGDIYHTSVSQFIPHSIKITQIYKRFEERWSENLKNKTIRLGSGHFRMYAMKQPYVPCKEVIYYVNGDMDLIRQLIEQYLVGLGNDIRIGFGMIRDVVFEETEEDYSLVAEGIAMRPIPATMCEEYDDSAYLPYKAPYWSPRNVVLCVPPGARCKLKDEYQRSVKTMG
ncbi:MAG TPA: hypothetical protein PK390_07190 [Fervidobacterium nodosum]|nr:hypothetical protein [Fervidobacterium nodosum]